MSTLQEHMAQLMQGAQLSKKKQRKLKQVKSTRAAPRRTPLKTLQKDLDARYGEGTIDWTEATYRTAKEPYGPLFCLQCGSAESYYRTPTELRKGTNCPYCEPKHQATRQTVLYVYRLHLTGGSERPLVKIGLASDHTGRTRPQQGMEALCGALSVPYSDGVVELLLSVDVGVDAAKTEKHLLATMGEPADLYDPQGEPIVWDGYTECRLLNSEEQLGELLEYLRGMSSKG